MVGSLASATGGMAAVFGAVTRTTPQEQTEEGYLTEQSSRNSGARPVRRLLVVDDDPLTNRVLQLRLTKKGYQVDSAAGGEEALAMLDASRPDLVFLDVSMPGVGGLEVLQEVRARGLDAAVVMMTAYGTEEIAVEALRHGADDYLRKPFEPTEFEAVLERTVERLELVRQNAALRRELDKGRRRLEAELARAARVQADLLPSESPKLPGFDLAARCVPAREIGGDFYDWNKEEDDLALTLGDVMGKGMPAALLMANARAVVRALSSQNPPAATVNLAARALELDLERSASFVTLFHAHLDTARSRVSYVDAGHGHVFLRRASGATERLKAGGIPLGALPDQTYEEGSVVLGQGDALVVYSDGLVEAREGPTPDAATISGYLDGARSAEEMVSRLISAAKPHGPPPDDLTVMVLYNHGSSS